MEHVDLTSDSRLNVEEAGELTAGCCLFGLVQPEERPRTQMLTGRVSKHTVPLPRLFEIVRTARCNRLDFQ